MHTRIVAFLLALLIVLVGGCAPSPASTPTAPAVQPAPEFGELTRMGRGKTDKADQHDFTEIYEHIFYPLKNSPVRVAEIGIAGGGSLKLWSEYFSKGVIFGLDIYTIDQLHEVLKQYPQVKDMLPDKPESDRIKTFVADQANRGQLKSFIDKYGENFDIILDDGGHTMEQQQVSFGFFFKYVKPGGYYVIEDVHTSLPDRFPRFGVEKDEANTTLTMINEFARHADIKSKYLLPEEIEYLKGHLAYVNLFARNNEVHSMTCIFKKKAS